MADWDEILAREGPAAWRTAYRIVGNRADADECFQEAFLDAWEVARRGPVGSWRALLGRLAAARAVDRLRRRLRRGPHGAVADWDALRGPDPPPSKAAEDAELSAGLRRALAHLPTKQAEAFCLQALEGWSYAEIAAHLGETTDAVGVLLHRARAAPAQPATPAGSPRPAANGAGGRAVARRGGAIVNDPAPMPAPEDRLARAEAALRRPPVPGGPSQGLVARTRAALRAAEESQSRTRLPRRNPMIATFKIAAAAAAAAGLSYLAAAPRAGATTSFAEAARKLQDARTLSYRVSVTVPGQGGPTTGREFIQDPGLVRTEGDPPQASVTVFDTARGKLLSLDPVTKVAILQDLKPTDEMRRRAQGRASDMAKRLRALAGKDGAPAGRRTIGGIVAEGFRVEDEGFAWIVRVDPVRKLPLLMETTLRFEGQDVPATLSDFRVDPPLDASLFSLDPPDGYKLSKVDAPIALGEEALVNLLRLYATASGGAFPPKPADAAAFQKQFPKERWKGQDDPEMIRLVQSMAASIVFLQFELKNAYGYTPDGVKLGEACKVLLWYRPKDSKTYRAIFGDLHAEAISPDRLPEGPRF